MRVRVLRDGNREYLRVVQGQIIVRTRVVECSCPTCVAIREWGRRGAQVRAGGGNAPAGQ